MMLNELTVIVPTHNRKNLISRFLSYYQCKIPNLLIVDSSPEKFNYLGQVDCKALHLPNMPMPAKLYHAANLVDTKYTFICADDDFFSIRGVLAGMEFLEVNQDFTSVQGNYVNFDTSNGSNYYWPLYAESAGYRNDSDSLKTRIEKTFSRQCFYSLRRTSSYKQIATALKSNIPVSTLEIGTHIIEPYLGKHAVLNVFWMARDSANYTPYQDLQKEKMLDDLNTLHLHDWPFFLKTDEGVKFLDDIYRNIVKTKLTKESFFLTTKEILSRRQRHYYAKKRPNSSRKIRLWLKKIIPGWLIWNLKRLFFRLKLALGMRTAKKLASVNIDKNEVIDFLNHAKNHQET